MPAHHQPRADARAPRRRERRRSGELSVADLVTRVHLEDTAPLTRVSGDGDGPAEAGDAGPVEGAAYPGEGRFVEARFADEWSQPGRLPEPRGPRLPEPRRPRAAERWAAPRSAEPHRAAAPAGPATAHREPRAGNRTLGHWLAGALAAATVLTTTFAVSGLGRPDSDAGAALAAGDVAAPPAATPAQAPAAPATTEATQAAGPTGDARPRPGTRAAAPAPKKVVDCASKPAKVLNLANWKLTLPTGGSEKPTEVEGSQLNGFTSADWFATRDDCRAVAFRAPVNGVTTSGSKNPRSELREMSRGGEKAGWSSTSGTHTMAVREAFSKLPQGKPHLVGAQIHDAEDDVTVFRLEGTKLYVTNGDDTHFALADANYRLGTPFEARYVVSGGQVKAFYNGRLVTTIAKSFSGAYFKAGAYTQANCENAAPCSSANYGETLIYDLDVRHS